MKFKVIVWSGKALVTGVIRNNSGFVGFALFI